MSKEDMIKIGAVLQDNDKRNGGRRITVEDVRLINGEWHVVYKAGYRIAKINFANIFTDGRFRAKGWNFVQQPHTEFSSLCSSINKPLRGRC